MSQRKNYIWLVCLLLVSSYSVADEVQLSEANKHCLECHANQTFKFYNEWMETTSIRMMNPFYIIDSISYLSGVHGSFNCFDCHSPDYETYPHNAELKLEPLNTCIDCHGGDETYADFKFDMIEEEFSKSIHYKISGESFTCSKCHNPHYYKTTARMSASINEIVSYNNTMCLSCHNNDLKYQTVSGTQLPQLGVVHDWLPNQELHFQKVRCIECHTQVVDSFMVSHNILPKEEALNDCNGCHSANSLLKASLYKYQNIQARSEEGKLGALISNEAYIIGANQNPFLKLISWIIFGITLFAIALHWIFRTIKRKKS